MSNVLIISHGFCSDGNAAAWAFSKKFPDATFHPATHGSLPPDVSGKEVYVVDFAYPREIMLDMKSKAKSLLVLDHHKSAMETLGDLDFCVFDMQRSGAGMAWDFCFPNKPRHWIVDYTEDKDIWRWSHPFSREINCNLQSRPLNFDTLNSLQHIKNDWWNKKEWQKLIDEGSAILRHQRNMVNDIANRAYEVEIQGHKVLVVNSPVLQSEVASFLSINRPFGACWFRNEKGFDVYSFRSRDGGIDVSKIAAQYGGGGHQRASGARVQAGVRL